MIQRIDISPVHVVHDCKKKVNNYHIHLIFVDFVKS